ncbi:MAG: ABC transporter ATP-binding protein [Desulfobacteraceae bacterium]|nr:ABC transporter ATP-binding protein [Desulfobacteraceae bacterium]
MTKKINNANAPAPIIELENISFAYPGRPAVLKDLTFSMYRQERIGLIAPNGCGKTTLFHIIMGLLFPQAGRLKLFGNHVNHERDFAEMRGRIGLLFQDADDQLFSPTVLEDVAFGPLNMGKSMDKAIEISRRILDKLGLKGFENRITFKLSGGEKRLVALATVLAMEPEVLLLDEPTSGLDDDTRTRLKDILNELDLSYILISHDFDFMSDVVSLFYSIKDGRMFEDTQQHLHSHQHCHAVGIHPHEHG